MASQRPMPPSDIISRLRDLHRMAWAAPHELSDELTAPNEDPNAKLDDDAVRPLHLAAISPMPGATEGIEALLAAGADPNLVDGMGAPPLFWAARWGEAATVAEIAVKTDGAAELRDTWDRTVAHWWAMGDDGTGKTSVQVLADVKADFAAIDHIGAGPMPASLSGATGLDTRRAASRSWACAGSAGRPCRTKSKHGRGGGCADEFQRGCQQ